MSANQSPIFVRSPKTFAVALTANTTNAISGSGSVLLASGGVEGVRLHALHMTTMTSFTESALTLWLEIDGTKHLLGGHKLPATTVATSGDAYTLDLLDIGWVDPNDKFLTIPPSTSLYVGTTTSIATAVSVVAQGGEY